MDVICAKEGRTLDYFTERCLLRLWAPLVACVFPSQFLPWCLRGRPDPPVFVPRILRADMPCTVQGGLGHGG